MNSAQPLQSHLGIDWGNTMQMLYDSESFVVVHMLPDAVETSTQALNDTAPPRPQLARHGFEIVDKRSGKEVYLDGSWAEMFQQQILAWQRDTPTQEEVEDALDRYAGLAQNPVVVHCIPLRRCAPSPKGDDDLAAGRPLLVVLRDDRAPVSTRAVLFQIAEPPSVGG